jgi:excisionase family DNA binding protein
MSGDLHQEPAALPQQASAAQHGTMLPLAEVAQRLGVSLATVRRMLKRDQLEGAELAPGATGQQWLVPLATVESHLASRRAVAADQQVSRTPPPAQVAAVELEELRTRVASLEAQLATQRALADERAHALEQLHLTVRLALNAGTQEPQARRRWWQRRQGDQRTDADQV